MSMGAQGIGKGFRGRYERESRKRRRLGSCQIWGEPRESGKQSKQAARRGNGRSRGVENTDPGDAPDGTFMAG